MSNLCVVWTLNNGYTCKRVGKKTNKQLFPMKNSLYIVIMYCDHLGECDDTHTRTRTRTRTRTCTRTRTRTRTHTHTHSHTLGGWVWSHSLTWKTLVRNSHHYQHETLSGLHPLGQSDNTITCYPLVQTICCSWYITNLEGNVQASKAVLYFSCAT